ncbi:MAG: hypothetical protein RMI91_15385, partial [Gemmatales bacterium]|nr:hypothetical protein [Gemmatales bacterium]
FVHYKAKNKRAITVSFGIGCYNGEATFRLPNEVESNAEEVVAEATKLYQSMLKRDCYESLKRAFLDTSMLETTKE